MKKLSTKFVAMILCVIMLISMVGCAKKEADTSTTENGSVTNNTNGGTSNTNTNSGTKEKVNITYWIRMNGNVSQVLKNYSENTFYKVFMEKTGLNIEFLHPPVEQEAEQFKLMVASRNDLPDVIETNWTSNYQGGLEKAYKDGIIIQLNNYLDYLPNYMNFLKSNPDIQRECVTDEGNYYCLYGMNESIYSANGLFLRKDWLDAAGLASPITIEDWETVLRAFKERDGVEHPIGLKSDDILKTNGINLAFQVGHEFYRDDNGKVKYGPMEEGYKEYIKLLNKWYTEGFLDPDFASIDGKIIESNLLNNKFGVVSAWVGSGLSKWYNATQDPNFALTAAPTTRLNVSDEGFNILSNTLTTGEGLAITTKASEEQIKVILTAYDTLYTPEGRLLKNFGVEGETYNMVDGKPVFSDLILKNPDGLGIGQAMGKYVQCNYPAIGICEVKDYTNQYFQLDAQKEAFNIFNEFLASGLQHGMPKVTPTTEEANEMAAILTEVNTYKAEMLVAFITGVEPIENYDSFVQQLKNLGIERAIELKQASVERFYSR